jgi:hypothetical protein
MKTRIEIQVEDQEKSQLLEVDVNNGADFKLAVLKQIGLDEANLFLHDDDAEIGDDVTRMKAVVLVAHRCKKLVVTINYEEKSIRKKFAPSATVFRVLQWAIGRNGFKLDATAAAKANLILPEAEQPLPREGVIGKYADKKTCSFEADLTLKDFTNG